MAKRSVSRNAAAAASETSMATLYDNIEAAWQQQRPDLDMAIKQVPIIYDILKQLPDERPMADAFTDLATALKNGSAAHLAARQRG